MEGGRWDMLEWLGPDASISVFNYLDNPADLARVGAVSKSWRKFVISNQFGKRLCMTLCPEISNFTHIQLWKRYSHQNASPSTSMDWQILERAHIAYTYFAHCFLSCDSDKDCIMTCIGASSTDRFPVESIHNTLVPTDMDHMVYWRSSYWSSAGQADPNVQESLIYHLKRGLYLVNEIRIRPFKAFFQVGDPIYSAKHVRFRMGHSKF
ncbi:hypothetical protein LUZ61_018125 [Rhynchospora tenuis]|uniref:F-box domain-containing protein n=1 Tax=Rhynchospora tenuis TaxID=198213 RepID=A0AAD5Z8T7_9POAL|nr:hypothetical protein LUZ61_018125 [Rhynchospora tenuis]